MSEEYYLYSPSTGRRAMIAYENLAGITIDVDNANVRNFIRWAITHFIKDVAMVHEDKIQETDHEPNAA